MQFVLLIGSLLGYAAFVARRWRLPFGVAMFVGVSSILVVLYAAALAGVLRTASFLVLALGLLLCAASAGTVEGRSTLRRLCAPALVGYGIAALLLWLRLRGQEYAQWDEFSHWGLYTKTLATTHTLPGADSAVILKTYPPGAAIWQYFVTRAVGFSEGHVYFAQALLLATPLLGLTDDRWRNWASTVAMIVLFYLALFLVGNELQSLLVDQLVGVFFGGVLAVYVLSSRDAAAVARAAPPLFCLVILKEVGILLATIAAAVILLDQGMRRIWPPARDSREGAERPAASARSVTGALALLVLAPVFAAASWHVYVRMNDLGRPMVAGTTIEQVRRSFSAAATPRDITTISRFRDALGEAAVGNAYTGRLLNAAMTRLGMLSEVKARARGRLEPAEPKKMRPLAENAVSVTQLLSALAATSTVLFLVLPSAGDRRLLLILTGSLLIGLAAYLGGLLLLYLHTLSEYEGTRLASFGRYVGMFFLGWTVALLGILRCALRTTGWRRRLTWAVVTVVAVGFVYTAPAAAYRWPLRGAPRLAVRGAVADLAHRVRSEVQPNESAFIVWQNTNGLEFYILRYELAPRVTNVHGFTVGTPYSASDVWTWPLPLENFASMIREFDYLLVASADDQFWAEYGVLLAPEAAGKKAVLFYSRGTPMDARLTIKRVFFQGR